MWATADIDGRDLARSFYKLVFSYKTKGGNYYERMAEALRDAVRKLRGKGGITLERRVSFIMVHNSQMSVRGQFVLLSIRFKLVALICSDTTLLHLMRPDPSIVLTWV